MATEAPKFHQATLKDLRRVGAAVMYFPLSQSLTQLRMTKEGGRPIIGYVDDAISSLEGTLSLSGHVAIFPKEPYVPDSNNLPLDEQKLMQEVDFEEIIARRWGIGGAENHFGTMTTHAAIAIALRKRRRIRLHGEDFRSTYGIPVTSTETLVEGTHFATVGSWTTKQGLYIDQWDGQKGLPAVWTTRLLVPVRE